MGTQSKFTPPGIASLTAATTGTGRAIALNDCRSINWSIVGNGAVGAGAVQIESAHTPDYAGTWKPLTAAPVTVVADANVGDKYDGPPPGGFVRARVTTNITGGTCTVYLNGLING